MQETAMQHLDERLLSLQQKAARRSRLEIILEELRVRLSELQEEVLRLDHVCRCEEYDLNRLEGLSLAGLFDLIAGKRAEKLTCKRAEAQTARAEYEAAAAELERLKQEIARHEAELAVLGGCEQEYAALLEERAAALKASGSADGRQLLEADTRAAQLQMQMQEIAQAQLAGAQALNTTHEIIARLEFARRMHCHDPLFSGHYHTVQTREALKAAQQHARRLPAQLQDFRNELLDLQLQFHTDAGEFNPPRFTGYTAIGGIIVKSKTLDFIDAALERLRAVAAEAAGIQQRLEALAAEAKKEQASLAQQRLRLIKGPGILPGGD